MTVLKLLVVVALASSAPAIALAQQSLSALSPSGQTVTPAFEGWYKNHDGTFSLSFGFLNRNTVEQVDVPIGENNFVSPGAQNQGQPTHFDTRRHWGVFAVVVPANFGEKKVTWILKFRGQTYAISGSLRDEWQIDAIEGEASADNTPPAISFAAGGPSGQGPLGITTGPLTAKMGQPLTINLIVKDDAKAEPIARAPNPVSLTWFRHQGPGAVTFAPPTAVLKAIGGNSSMNATFSVPGEYLLRVRANDGSVAAAGHSQCCWTNGFVKVTVTP